MFKVLKGHIEGMTKCLQFAKVLHICVIDKEEHAVLKPAPEMYGSTADIRSVNRDVIVKVRQTTC